MLSDHGNKLVCRPAQMGGFKGIRLLRDRNRVHGDRQKDQGEKIPCDVTDGSRDVLGHDKVSLEHREPAPLAFGRSFSEDCNTTMDQNAFNNMCIMNKMALSLLKLVRPAHKVGIKSIRKKFPPVQ